jgi:hypothetical protein
MAPDALVKVGGPNRTEDTFDEDYQSSDYCHRTVADEGRTGHVAHRRLWRANGFIAINVAHGYHLKLGKQAVDEARRNSALCRTYETSYSDGTKIKYDLLDAVDLGVVPGTDDHFAICDKRTYGSGSKNVACLAYLGRNHFLTLVMVFVSADVAAARTKLTQVVPIAAATLVAAAP